MKNVEVVHLGGLGLGVTKRRPLHLRLEKLALHSSDSLDGWAVSGGNTTDAPLLDGIDAGCSDRLGKCGDTASLMDGFVECSFGVHLCIVDSFSINAQVNPSIR